MSAGLHRGIARPCRAVRTRRRRHAVPRRDRRDPPGPPGQAAARAAGALVRAGRRGAHPRGRHPRDRRHQPRPARGGAARAASGRTSTSASASSPWPRAPARAARGHRADRPACPPGAARRLNIPAPRLTEGDVRRLVRYPWPGNVRELENVIERAAILAVGGRLRFDLPDSEPAGQLDAGPSRRPVDRPPTEAERRARDRADIAAALALSGGKVFGPGALPNCSACARRRSPRGSRRSGSRGGVNRSATGGASHTPHGPHVSRSSLRFPACASPAGGRRPPRRRRAGLERRPRPRAADVGQHGRGLCARPAPVSRPSREPRRNTDDPDDRRPEAARHPRLPGGPPGRRDRRALADAGARRLALLCQISRARGPRHRRGPRGRALAQGRTPSAQAPSRRRRPRADRPVAAGRRGPRALDPSAGCRGARAALRGGPAHLRGAGFDPARRAGPRRGCGDGARQRLQAADGAGASGGGRGGGELPRRLPAPCRRTVRSSSAPAAVRSRRGSSSMSSRTRAAPSASPTAPRRMRCATPSRRICSRAKASFAPFRTCSAMPRSRRRSSTPRSTRRA